MGVRNTRSRAGWAAGASVLAAALCIPVSVAAKPTLELTDLRATVDIYPENRPDFAITIDPADDGVAAPTVIAHGDLLKVSGSAETGVPTFRVSYNLDRRMDIAAMKQRAAAVEERPSALLHLQIHAPQQFLIRSNAQIYGHIHAGRSVTLRDGGRGQWDIDAMERDVEVHGYGASAVKVASADSVYLDLMGTGSVVCGDVQRLLVDIYGAGDVSVDAVRAKAEVNISGIGDFRARSITGTLRVDMDDAGQVEVLQGALAALTVRSQDGRGAVAIAGAVRDADIRIGTQTVVRLPAPTGTVSQSVRDAARVEIIP